FMQIKAEFHPYFERCSQKITQQLKQRPKTFLYVMVILMALSTVISFFILSNKEPVAKHVKAAKVSTVSDGFSQILSTAATIKQGLAIKHEIDSLSSIKTLSTRDSQTLINDLDKLHQLN